MIYTVPKLHSSLMLPLSILDCLQLTTTLLFTTGLSNKDRCILANSDTIQVTEESYLQISEDKQQIFIYHIMQKAKYGTFVSNQVKNKRCFFFLRDFKNRLLSQKLAKIISNLARTYQISLEAISSSSKSFDNAMILVGSEIISTLCIDICLIIV